MRHRLFLSSGEATSPSSDMSRGRQTADRTSCSRLAAGSQMERAGPRHEGAEIVGIREARAATVVPPMVGCR
jgi:hypothetical protein